MTTAKPAGGDNAQCPALSALCAAVADALEAPAVTAAARALSHLRSVLEHDQIGTPTG